MSSLIRDLSLIHIYIQREFYINDHGSQMDVFGNSISYRYMQLIEIMEKEGLDIDGARDFLAQDRRCV